MVDKEILDKMYTIYRKSCDVINFLRGGLQESAYQAALEWELNQIGMKVLIEHLFRIWYKGHQLSKGYKLDLVIDDSIIVELKAKDQLTSEHRLQLFNYMRLTHIPYGVLANFGLDGTISFERYSYDKESNSVLLIDWHGNPVYKND